MIRSTVAKYRAKDATAIVLDPRTGAVLAMAVAPTYDANRYPDVPASVQRNRAITDTYEPGSTFKLVTVAGALSQGLVTPSTPFVLPYDIHVADRVIHDAEPRGTERFTVAEILSHSSNVGAITLAEAARPAGPRGLDLPLRLRPRRPGSTSRREPRLRAPARPVVGLDDRQRPDRPGDRGHADADGLGVRGDRERRRLAAAARRRPRERPAASSRSRRAAMVSAPIAHQLVGMLKNVVLDGTGTEAAVPGYQVAGQDGHRAEAGPARLHDRQVRRVVRRLRPRVAAAPGDPGRGRRAADA